MSFIILNSVVLKHSVVDTLTFSTNLIFYFICISLIIIFIKYIIIKSIRNNIKYKIMFVIILLRSNDTNKSFFTNSLQIMYRSIFHFSIRRFTTFFFVLFGNNWCLVTLIMIKCSIYI